MNLSNLLHIQYTNSFTVPFERDSWQWLRKSVSELLCTRDPVRLHGAFVNLIQDVVKRTIDMLDLASIRYSLGDLNCSSVVTE